MPAPAIDFDGILKESPRQEIAPSGDPPANDQDAPVEEKPEATAGPGEDAPADADSPDAPKEPPGKSASQRIAKLTAKAKDLERENRELRESQVRNPPPKQPTLAELHPSQFQNPEDYKAAVEAAALTEAEAKAQQTVANQTAERRKDDFFGKLRKEGKGIEGFEDVLAGISSDPEYLHISMPMAQYLMEDADNAAALLKWLADNPDESERIFGLTPTAATKELVRRDGLLSRKAAPPVSRAPAPTPSVSGSGSAPQSIERMSHEDLLKWTREQKRK